MENKFTKTKDGIFALHGDLSFANVAAVARGGYDLINKIPSIKFDFAEVNILDNAILALLPALMRYAKKKRKDIRFVKLSKQALDMARVSDLAALLPR
ncbi:MAG: STAS domain-containing protein [Gammaproteobacteria bacterium]